MEKCVEYVEVLCLFFVKDDYISVPRKTFIEWRIPLNG